MIIIGAGSEPAWRVVNITTVHGVGTEIVPGGITLWTPPFPCLVRAFTVNDDAGNPLVGAGGATSVSIGQTSGTNVLVNAASLASFGTGLICWGAASGPRVNDLNNAVMDAGLVFAPLGSIPGRSAVSRLLLAICNAGTVTGTLRMRLEMRPFAGGWA